MNTSRNNIRLFLGTVLYAVVVFGGTFGATALTFPESSLQQRFSVGMILTGVLVIVMLLRMSTSNSTPSVSR